MKKLMTVMLGLSLAMGSATLVFGQDKAPTKEDTKDKGDKKGKGEKGKAEQGKDEKGKGRKGQGR